MTSTQNCNAKLAVSPPAMFTVSKNVTTSDAKLRNFMNFETNGNGHEFSIYATLKQPTSLTALTKKTKSFAVVG